MWRILKMDKSPSFGGNRFTVFDDFFDPGELAEIRDWSDIHKLELKESVISNSDGKAWRSRTVVLDHSAASASPIFKSVLKAAKTSMFDGSSHDWEVLSAAVWRYPIGAALGWHNDAGRARVGEFVCFLHEEWSADWGGELVIIDEPAEHVSLDGAGGSTAITDFVSESSYPGTAVFPKPNRVVLLKAGTAHCIKRVEGSWSGRPRTTLTGFLSGDLALPKNPSHDFVRSLGA
jgi:hypothetical protein